MLFVSKLRGIAPQGRSCYAHGTMTSTDQPTLIKTSILTAFALIAFAGNSILNRLALAYNTIDAGSFTVIRLLSGILVLSVILMLKHKNRSSVVEASQAGKGSWYAGVMLFVYAAFFSYAYISLETGTGALILFGTVQITMISVGLFKGNKLSYLEWLGVLVAFGGFTYLMLPSATTPSLFGFLLMLIAGVAWGLYTLAGRGSVDPLGDTSFNFIRSIPLVILLCVVLVIQDSTLLEKITDRGLILAALSGGIASGVGYTIWYMALRGLSGVQAAVLQLLVPVIATIGGILFASESVSWRFILSTALVLGGILMVIIGKRDT